MGSNVYPERGSREPGGVSEPARRKTVRFDMRVWLARKKRGSGCVSTMVYPTGVARKGSGRVVATQTEVDSSVQVYFFQRLILVDYLQYMRAVFRFLLVTMCLIPGAAPLSGVTMQQLSVDELAVQSTAIIRGQVTSTYTALSGPTVYTHYRVMVTEAWKGNTGMTVDVAVPGGTAGGIRQSYPGVPQLMSGVDYVLYLWTSPSPGPSSGLTLPTGFSQGIFTVTGATPSGLVTSRSATSESMLDAAGHPVQDRAVSMPLAAMKSQVAAALARQVGMK